MQIARKTKLLVTYFFSDDARMGMKTEPCFGRCIQKVVLIYVKCSGYGGVNLAVRNICYTFAKYSKREVKEKL